MELIAELVASLSLSLPLILPFLGWALIMIGFFFITSGIVALLRFPDFYTKLHGAGVIECCGIQFCLIGLAILQADFAASCKLIIAAILIFLLNPVVTHALGRASLLYKIDPDGRIK